MPSDNVPVTTGTGATIAAELIGTVDYQRVKLIGGAVSDTTGIGTGGSLPVSVVGSVQVSGAVSVSAMPAVSGTVSVSGQVQVSGAVSISAMPAVSGVVTVATGNVTNTGTQAVNLGTVGFIGSTTAVSGVSGPIVWLGASQTVLAGTAVSQVISTILGTQIVTLASGAAISTLLGTVAVNVVAGGAAPGSTGGTQTNISGQVVWLAPTQTIIAGTSVSQVISTILGTQIVTLATGGVVTMVGTVPVNLGTAAFIGSTTAVSGVSGPIVWLGASQTILAGTAVSQVISTILGTQLVSVVGFSAFATNPGSAASGLGVYLIGLSTTALSGVTGPVVWLGASQTILAGTAVSQVISTILGTQVVTLATGGVVTMVGTVPVNLGTASFIGSTTAVSGVSGPQIWLGASQTINIGTLVSQVISTILGTQIVTLATGGVVTMVGTVAVNLGTAAFIGSTTALSGVSGPQVWVGNQTSVTVTVSGGTNVDVTTAAPAIGATAMVIREAGTVLSTINTIVTVLGSVQVKPLAKTPWMAVVTTTAAISAGTSLLMTVYTGVTVANAGVGVWAVPAGQTLHIQAIYGALGSSASTGRLAQLTVAIATAAGSLTSANVATAGIAANLWIQNTAIQTMGSIIGLDVVVGAATTIGLFFTMSSSITVSNYMLMGYLE